MKIITKKKPMENERPCDIMELKCMTTLIILVLIKSCQLPTLQFLNGRSPFTATLQKERKIVI